ncbi:hypothetical protein OAJ30_01130 [Alphaproteobacteria bacterium]|nr:hypothetical protein [Alphaproteobacteria bacterium]
MKILLTLFVLFSSSPASAGLISHIGCYYKESRILTLNAYGVPFGGPLFLIIFFITIFIWYKIENKIDNKSKKGHLFFKKNQNWFIVFGLVIIILYLYSAYRFGCLI